MTTNKKITELTELAEVDLSDDDVLAIVDVSAGTTNKVRKSTLASALAGVASLSATSPVTVSSSVGAVTVAVTTIPITSGGTGATNASAARTNLGAGDVVGPGSATDSALALFDGTTGKLIKDSTYTITAAGAALIDDASASAQRTTLGAGDVSGPASATNSGIVLFDGVGGTTIKDSGTTIADLTPELGFLNRSAWADSATETITLAVAADAISKVQVAVYEEIPDTNKTNNDWDIITSDTGFDLRDSAYEVTLTPAATTGSSVSFTLGSGSWSSDDIGKRIVNVSAGEAGVAKVLSVASGVATCLITTNFTDTSAIASGDWELYGGDFVNGAFELSNATEPAASGTPVVLTTSTSHGISVAMLTATKAIVTYADGANGRYGTARILDVSGTTITAGTPVVFDSVMIAIPKVVMLTSTKAMVCYRGASNYGYACILDVSVSTVTAGTPVVFEPGYIDGLSITALSSTKVITFCKDNPAGNLGTACVLDVSVSTITAGTPKVVTPYYINEPSVVTLTSTKALISYSDGNNSGYGTARILDVSGTTITEGTAVAFESAIPVDLSGAALTSTKVIVAYGDNGTSPSKQGTACILDVSVSTITAGTPVLFNPANSVNAIVSTLASNKALVTYKDGGNSGYSTYSVLDVSGSAITPATSVMYDTAVAGTDDNVPSTTFLTSTKAIFAYRDTGNSNIGTAIAFETESALYASAQQVATISGSDSVDTTFYDDLNSVTTTETLNGETANYAFSFNPTFTGTSVTGGTFIVVGNGETTARNIASSLASVHGGIDGTWYVNTNAVYASETWVASTINSSLGSLEQAEDTTANNMSGTDVNAVADVNWPAFGTDFAVAVILYSSSASATPSVDSIAFNYDGNVLNRLKTDQYTVEMPSVGTVAVTAPSSGGPRNARVYISK
jgi:hypothetical protein